MRCRVRCRRPPRPSRAPGARRRRSCATAVTSASARHRAWRVLLKCTASREGAGVAPRIKASCRPRSALASAPATGSREKLNGSDVPCDGGQKGGPCQARADCDGDARARKEEACTLPARVRRVRGVPEDQQRHRLGLTRLERSACWAGAGGQGESPGSTRSRALCRVAEARFEWGAATWYW